MFVVWLLDKGREGRERKGRERKKKKKEVNDPLCLPLFS
jgi:hypothetical protein